jgi:hypothetical protein
VRAVPRSIRSFSSVFSGFAFIRWPAGSGSQAAHAAAKHQKTGQFYHILGEFGNEQRCFFAKFYTAAFVIFQTLGAGF